MITFEPSLIPADDNDERTCGTCLQRKSVDAFYKDGKDSDGKVRVRRDCKECYRKTRLRNVIKKKKEAEKAKPKRRRRSGK